MSDAELLLECQRFLEDMHSMPVDWTIKESQDLHAKVKAQLAAPKWKVCPACMGRGLRDIAHGVTERCQSCNRSGLIAAPQGEGKPDSTFEEHFAGPPLMGSNPGVLVFRERKP